MARCNSCNGIITKTDVECYVCRERVPGRAKVSLFRFLAEPTALPVMNMRKPSDRDASLLMIARTMVLLLPLMLATPVKAFGYADPGTGTFVYQASYAAVLGGWFCLRKLFDRIRHRRK
jgi:hypothetical protein